MPRTHARADTKSQTPMLRVAGAALLVFGAAMLGGAAWGQDDAAQGSDKIISAHGYSFYGDLKYPADYTHFDYVNPDAPKGGPPMFTAKPIACCARALNTPRARIGWCSTCIRTPNSRPAIR